MTSDLAPAQNPPQTILGRRFTMCAVFILAATFSFALTQIVFGDTPKPLILLDPASAKAATQINVTQGDITPAFGANGLTLTVKGGGKAGWPGLTLKPATGTTWDLSPFGHVEAKFTNPGTKNLNFNFRVNNDGGWEEAPWNGTHVSVKPGETKLVTIIFGYDEASYTPGYKLKSEAVNQLVIFMNKADEDRTLVVSDIQAAGVTGEIPPLTQNSVITPKNGVILGPNAPFDPTTEVDPGTAKVTGNADGSFTVDFSGGREETIKIKPAMGSWNLNQANEIRVKFTNVGSTPITPELTVGPKVVTAPTPLAAGAEGELATSFVADVPAVGVKEIKGMFNGLMPGTGTTFESDKVKNFSLGSDASIGAKSLKITSIVADAPTDEMPDWLGQRPPVQGDWVKTFEENFDGPTVDLSKWNIYGTNYLDRVTHFSKEDDILEDGKMILRYEKKKGRQNDSPTGKETNYACGFLDTYGKWTQRYGYFEARMKLPKASGLWPAFWLMPDRGKGTSGPRDFTGKNPTDADIGGMEFDIMEFLSGWGPYRFNVALHWDGYAKDHKFIGNQNTYTRTDKDGYITSGLLWTPGSAVIYTNGKEVFRWEHPRISDLQSFIIFDMVSGGWANTRLDDSQLPDDFYIDYVRVWQRKDLASPADGPKPNNSDPNERDN